MPELYIGLLSGTSMDAVDAVLVDLAGHRPLLLGTCKQPLTATLREQLRSFAQPGPDEINRLVGLDAQMAEVFADCTLKLLADQEREAADIVAIGSHGQTVRHAPAAPVPYTLQIGDPNRLAERTGITTVADFRRRDMAAGGEGAPLVPAFHQALFRSPDEDRAVINIGGVANITLLPAASDEPVSGFDTGPGNTLLDAWARRHLDAPMDSHGNWAAGGKASRDLLATLMGDPWFTLPPPKSTGPELFSLEWLDAAVALQDTALDPQDVQATLCQFTASSIADALNMYAPSTQRVLLCGGGAHNADLVRRLGNAIEGMPLETTAAHGIHPDWVEAVAFAWLAQRTLRGEAGNLPAVTGAAHAVVLGGIYRGRLQGAD